MRIDSVTVNVKPKSLYLLFWVKFLENVLRENSFIKLLSIIILQRMDT